MPATSAATDDAEEARQVRALLTRRAIDAHAGDLLTDAGELVKKVGQTSGGSRLKATQLSALSELAQARGNVAEIVSFITSQMSKQGSREGWEHGNFGQELRERLLARAGAGKALTDARRGDIVTEVRQGLTAAVNDAVATELTDRDRAWREEVHLALARLYIGFVVAEYKFIIRPAAGVGR